MKNRVGRLYYVTEGDMDFSKGEVLELTRDDGDRYPRFRSLETNKEAFMCVKHVKKIPKMKVGRQYVVKEGVRQKIKLAGVKKFKCEKAEKKPVFEIGDIVRIKEVDGGGINRVGDIGVITEVEKDSARVHI